MLLQVPGDQFGHLEHADLLLAIEDDLQCGIRVDEGLLLGVLELVFLDVIPELLGEFGPGQRLGTDDCRQGFIGLDWLQEPSIWFSFGGFGGLCTSRRRRGLARRGFFRRVSRGAR